MASPYNFLNAPDDDWLEAYKYAQLPPHQQNALEMRRAERGVERGVQDMARGVLGLQPAAHNQRQAAADAIKALAKKVTPGTAEFYAQAAKILQEHGLVEEAEAMTEKGRALDQTKVIGDHDVTKLQRTIDTLQKRFEAGDVAVKPALDAAKRALGQIGVPREGSQPRPTKEETIWDRYQKALASGNQAEADYWKNQFPGGEKGMSEYQRLTLKFRERDEDRKQQQADDKAEQSTQAEQGALRQTARLIDMEIRDAKRLLNHKGLSKVVGTRVGQSETMQAVAEAAVGSGALALLKNIVAQTFIRSLQELKATSSTGASGLGQLSEREGDKIQNAKAALFPGQPVPQFMRTLRDYITQLEASYAEFASQASKMKVALPPRVAPVSDAPAPAADPARPAHPGRGMAPSKNVDDGWEAERLGDG